MLSVREGELRRIIFEKELWFELIFFRKKRYLFENNP